MSESSTRQMERWLAKVNEKVLRQAVARAANRTATNVRTAATKEVRKDLKVKASLIKEKSMRITKARPKGGVGFLNRIYAVLTVSYAPLPLYAFSPKAKKVNTAKGTFSKRGTQAPRIGVTVKVKSRRKLVKGGFIRRVGAGHVAIFVRKGKARLPIKEAFTTTVRDIFNNEGFFKRIKRIAIERFKVNYQNELRYRVDKEMQK